MENKRNGEQVSIKTLYVECLPKFLCITHISHTQRMDHAMTDHVTTNHRSL